MEETLAALQVFAPWLVVLSKTYIFKKTFCEVRGEQNYSSFQADWKYCLLVIPNSEPGLPNGHNWISWNPQQSAPEVPKATWKGKGASRSGCDPGEGISSGGSVAPLSLLLQISGPHQQNGFSLTVIHFTNTTAHTPSPTPTHHHSTLLSDPLSKVFPQDSCTLHPTRLRILLGRRQSMASPPVQVGRAHRHRRS